MVAGVWASGAIRRHLEVHAISVTVLLQAQCRLHYVQTVVLWNYAFRPFFLMAALYAILIVPLWVAGWLGLSSTPVIYGNPIAWHAHEMVWGFAGAAIAGFTLTAVATWTKRPPVAGIPLIVLCALWLVARLLFLMPVQVPIWLVASADVGFGFLLLALMSREVISARNTRNYKVLVLLAFFATTDLAFFVALARGFVPTMDVVLAGLWSVLILLNLVGSRIIPSFTANWLRRQTPSARSRTESLPQGFGRFDAVATWLLVAFAILHVTGIAAGWMALVGVPTGLMFLARLLRWQGHRTLSEPLVWVLHLAFAWIPIGVLLLSAAELGWVPRTAGTHALTVGAMTTMILAVASRAALGHTGRPLVSHPLLTASYVLITLAALARVGASITVHARALLIVSSAAWLLAFACFTWRYAPILTRPSAALAKA